MFRINYRDYLQIFTRYDLVEKLKKKKNVLVNFHHQIIRPGKLLIYRHCNFSLE